MEQTGGVVDLGTCKNSSKATSKVFITLKTSSKTCKGIMETTDFVFNLYYRKIKYNLAKGYRMILKNDAICSDFVSYILILFKTKQNKNHL